MSWLIGTFPDLEKDAFVGTMRFRTCKVRV